MYAHVRGRSPIVNEQGQVEPYVLAARKRGVIFDVGHGGGSFLWRQAVPAAKQGFFPDVISTDLHTGSQNAGMKDILNTMSKVMNLGMPLKDVIAANTSKAAAIIKRDDLGHLGVGTEADVAVLAVRKGEFGFIDSSGGRMAGTQKLECEVTIRAGQVVWDSEWPRRPRLDAPCRQSRRVAGTGRPGAPPRKRSDVRSTMTMPECRMPNAATWGAALAVTLVVAASALAQPAASSRRVIMPEGAPAGRPYSPGVMVGQDAVHLRATRFARHGPDAGRHGRPGAPGDGRHRLRC